MREAQKHPQLVPHKGEVHNPRIPPSCPPTSSSYPDKEGLERSLTTSKTPLLYLRWGMDLPVSAVEAGAYFQLWFKKIVSWLFFPASWRKGSCYTNQVKKGLFQAKTKLFFVDTIFHRSEEVLSQNFLQKMGSQRHSMAQTLETVICKMDDGEGSGGRGTFQMRPSLLWQENLLFW